MTETHNEFIDFQFGIMDDLANGRDFRKVAKDARDKIKEIYDTRNNSGDKIPSGLELGVDVNRICNLKCSHCYLADTHIQNEYSNQDDLTSQDWKNLIYDAKDFGVRTLSIVGKEPLLSPDTTKIILETAENRGLNYRILTNGTLIPSEINWLKQFNFSFTSISFDGDEPNHDKIRGQGNYQKALEGLRTAKKAGLENLTANFTTMTHNVNSLDKMLPDLVNAGLDYLSVGFCFETSYNDLSLIPTQDIFYKTIDQLKNASKNIKSITLNLMGKENSEIVAGLWNQGYFKKQNSAILEDFAPSLLFPINDSPKTFAHLTILPLVNYSGFRIGPEGIVTDFCEDLMQHPLKGFGNIKKDSFAELYEKSKTRWKESSENYYQTLQNSLLRK